MIGVSGVSAVLNGLNSKAVDDGFMSNSGVAASNPGFSKCSAFCWSVAVDGEAD